jgi:hypothetical protein
VPRPSPASGAARSPSWRTATSSARSAAAKRWPRCAPRPGAAGARSRRLLAERSPDPLVALARAVVAGWSPPDALPSLVGREWERTVTRAERERLAPALHVALRGGGAPPTALARLRAAWLAAERQHLLADAQLREIVAALGGAGIEAIVLKGPALAEYYPDPALRPFTDLDLLVRRRDREAALEVLARLGYAHGSPGRSLAYELEHAAAVSLVASPDASRLPVDLHWECIAHPGGARATALAAEEIWSRAVPAPAWGAAARALAPEDLLVYLAAHLAIHHALAGALWRLDLALVLERHAATLDWDAVGARAVRWGVAAAAYFALRAVGDELGVAAPAATLDRLRPGALRVALVDHLQRLGSERLGRLEHLVDLLVIDRLSDAVRVLVAGLVPPPSWLRARYDSPSLVAAYLRHYGRMAAVVGRAVPRRWPRGGVGIR